MKCIKSIRETKENKVGEIIRVDDKVANNMVGNMWKYVSKKEWKEYRGLIKKEKESEVQETTEVIDNVKPDKKRKKTKK